jgi:arylsulfatase A-like enzyme
VEFMRKYEPDYTLVDGLRPYRPNLRDATGLYGGSILLLGRLNQGKIVLTPDERDHLISLYDAEIAFVDSNIQQVLDKIKELGLWENTMVILNADHGEVFGEHGKYYHGHTIYEQQVRIPLIIKPPRSQPAGKVIDGPVRNLDIAPTILDYCNIRIPGEAQGKSLRSFIEEESSPNLPACMETRNVQTLTHMLGYRTGHYKVIYDLSRGSAELYDLAEDPHERNNLLVDEGLAQARQDPAAHIEFRLQKKLLTTLGVEELSALKLGEESTSMDPQTRERLKALGYIY